MVAHQLYLFGDIGVLVSHCIGVSNPAPCPLSFPAGVPVTVEGFKMAILEWVRVKVDPLPSDTVTTVVSCNNSQNLF
jgi:hypothetical protein